MNPIQLAIIEPDPRRLQLIQQKLATAPHIQVTDQRTTADVLLLDLHSAPAILPQNGIVLLLVQDAEREEEAILAMLAQGCRGFINPETEADLLLKAIETVATGEAWISRRILACMLERKLQWQPICKPCQTPSES